MALNDTTIRSLKPEGRKRELLLADVAGLHLRVRIGRSGKITRTWQYRERGDGITRIATLGSYPAVPLKEARLRAAEHKLKGTISSPTVADVADQWFAEIVAKTRKDADTVRWFLDRAMRDIGSMRIADVQPKDIAKAVRTYRDEAAKNARATSGGRVSARIMLVTLKGLFGYGVATGAIAASPAAAITGAALGAPNKARDRVLSDDEIRWVMSGDAPQAAVWRFLLATGLRLGEVYAGHRDGDYWMVPADQSKNGKAHRVHLSPLALAQIEDQPWPPRWSVQISLSLQKKGWTCHDLRRTFATRLNDMKLAPPYVVEKALNHTLPGVQSVYNHAEHLEERREALERWSDWLSALVDRPTADVVPLRQVAASG